APQPNCKTATCRLDTGTTHISGEVKYASGSLFATINTNSSAGTPAILLWEVHPTVDDNAVIVSAQIRREVCFGCSGFSNGGGAYYGTIDPDSEGNWTMVYNFSSTTTFPSTVFLTNRVSQAPNTVHDAGVVAATGNAFYQVLDNAGRNR